MSIISMLHWFWSILLHGGFPSTRKPEQRTRISDSVSTLSKIIPEFHRGMEHYHRNHFFSQYSDSTAVNACYTLSLWKIMLECEKPCSAKMRSNSNMNRPQSHVCEPEGRFSFKCTKHSILCSCFGWNEPHKVLQTQNYFIYWNWNRNTIVSPKPKANKSISMQKTSDEWAEKRFQAHTHTHITFSGIKSKTDREQTIERSSRRKTYTNDQSRYAFKHKGE